VVTSGGGVDMTRWIDKVPALLAVWYPGQEGGTALAQLLFGEYSPAGKLPASFEKHWEDNATSRSYYPPKNSKRIEYSEEVFVGYRHFDHAGIKLLFPFGFGLSYSQFEYGHLQIEPLGNSGNALARVSFQIKNVGTREAAEAAQLYVGDSHSGVPRPAKELKGFAKVNLLPGETKHITLLLDRRALSFFDVKKHDWHAEPGDFAILIGSSSADIRLQGNFKLGSE
jgi:beta-glucosidase